ncbi:hypothetical protein GCM10010221_45350 [Streptomyces parvus]|nr:hypothetical protein GCM10010221_45350 [Streptomyces parvus]
MRTATPSLAAKLSFVMRSAACKAQAVRPVHVVTFTIRLPGSWRCGSASLLHCYCTRGRSGALPPHWRFMFR